MNPHDRHQIRHFEGQPEGGRRAAAACSAPTALHPPDRELLRGTPPGQELRKSSPSHTAQVLDAAIRGLSVEELLSTTSTLSASPPSR